MSASVQIQAPPMRVRHLPGPDGFDRLTSEEIRQKFLVRELFEPGELNLVSTGLDRLVIGGAMPRSQLQLAAYRELGTSYFAERREIGMLNIGERGAIRADGETFVLERLDCLYLGMGTEQIHFEDVNGAIFYLCSSPAHQRYPAALLRRRDAVETEIGDARSASKRRIVKYICAEAIPSCQLVMGFTELEPASVWNTMPPHTHSRRSEVYTYFDLGDDVVFHMCGTPANTRQIVLRDREAALSPGWSIHAGVGTGNYRFAWAMAGENQDFSDVDPLTLHDLK